jgi:hypothetical protein
MDITCSYCAAMNSSGVVPICMECNKYWYINDFYKDGRDISTELSIELEKLYTNLFSDKDYVEKHEYYRNTLLGKFNKLEHEYYHIKDARKKLLTRLYNKINKFKLLLLEIELFKFYIKTYNYEELKLDKIKLLNKRIYLSSLYDCKALIGDASAS